MEWECRRNWFWSVCADSLPTSERNKIPILSPVVCMERGVSARAMVRFVMCVCVCVCSCQHARGRGRSRACRAAPAGCCCAYDLRAHTATAEAYINTHTHAHARAHKCGAEIRIKCVHITYTHMCTHAGRTVAQTLALVCGLLVWMMCDGLIDGLLSDIYKTHSIRYNVEFERSWAYVGINYTRTHRVCAFRIWIRGPRTLCIITKAVGSFAPLGYHYCILYLMMFPYGLERFII